MLSYYSILCYFINLVPIIPLIQYLFILEDIKSEVMHQDIS